MNPKLISISTKTLVLLASLVPWTEGQDCGSETHGDGEKIHFKLPERGRVELMVQTIRNIPGSTMISLDDKCLLLILHHDQGQWGNCYNRSTRDKNVTVAFKRVDNNVHMSFQGEEFNFLSVALPVQLRAGLNMKFWGHNVITSHKYYDEDDEGYCGQDIPRQPPPDQEGSQLPLTTTTPSRDKASGAKDKGDDEANNDSNNDNVSGVTLASPDAPDPSAGGGSPEVSAGANPDVSWVVGACLAAVGAALVVALVAVLAWRRSAAARVALMLQEKGKLSKEITDAEGPDLQLRQSQIGARPSSCQSHDSINSLYGQV
ncbi:uncharacterized protein LOC122254559 isoform X2 [Penaeus japonicus]|uniref:uncharacterized protein LOC122254559 isoform X2 n=1 Tax=Penaeus japonicus TaxID=27405 RepID=UPI001C70D30A|nr:uncharacterized protein LOC122254559 isoform X2 [Penaeus japonicus]